MHELIGLDLFYRIAGHLSDGDTVDEALAVVVEAARRPGEVRPVLDLGSAGYRTGAPGVHLGSRCEFRQARGSPPLFLPRAHCHF